jgi:hypothetical protein
MLIMGHIKECLTGSGQSCLLKNIGQDDGSFLLVNNEVAKKEGGYLYWDKVDLCWRRKKAVMSCPGALELEAKNTMIMRRTQT